jgi:hypothetical protein
MMVANNKCHVVKNRADDLVSRLSSDAHEELRTET